MTSYDKKMVRHDEERMREMMECFALFDRKSTGTLSPEDVPTIIRALGHYITDREVAQIRSRFAAGMSLNDLASLLEELPPQEPVDSALAKAFEVFDSAKTGRVPVKEVRHILTNVGDKLRTDEFDELLERSELSIDQSINMQQFISLIKGGN